MDSKPQRKLHFHENDESPRVNEEDITPVHLWDSLELQNLDDPLEIDGEEEISDVYGLQENICQAQENFMERSTCGRINVQEPVNVVKKISTWKEIPYEGIPKVFPGGPNPKCNQTCHKLCWETIECEETKDCERINVQEQLSTVKEMSTRKQMPLEGLPKVDRTLCYDFVLPGVPLYLRNTCWKTSDRQKLVTK